MIKLTQGQPASGSTYSLCGPSDINGAGRVMTAPSVPGPGVRTSKRLSNLDKNGRLVRKGCTVHFKHITLPGCVVKVMRGKCLALPVGWAYPVSVECSALEVVL